MVVHQRCEVEGEGGRGEEETHHIPLVEAAEEVGKVGDRVRTSKRRIFQRDGKYINQMNRSLFKTSSRMRSSLQERGVTVRQYRLVSTLKLRPIVWIEQTWESHVYY